MKKLRFNEDHEIQWARYKAGETPEQWFSNEDADRLESEGIAEIIEVDEYTTLCAATAATPAVNAEENDQDEADEPGGD
jgi:hypothetical protein